MMSINLNDIATLNINGVDYCWNINRISKSKAVNLLENADLTEKSHQYKNPILIYNKDINKILVFNRVSFIKKGFKYFIGYKDGKKVKLLCVMLPKMSTYRRDFDER